jgi:hypothetical protein
LGVPRGPIVVGDGIETIDESFWKADKDGRFVAIGGGAALTTREPVREQRRIWRVWAGLIRNVPNLAAGRRTEPRGIAPVLEDSTAQPVNQQFECVFWLPSETERTGLWRVPRWCQMIPGVTGPGENGMSR